MLKLYPNVFVSLLFIVIKKVPSLIFLYEWYADVICEHCLPMLPQYTFSLSDEGVAVSRQYC
jgi:hypothetical protein